MENAFSRRAGYASISTLDVRTDRLQWRTALHWRGHHKIEYTLEASLRQVRPEPTMAGKWLELLKQIAPRIARVAMLFKPVSAPFADYWLNLSANCNCDGC